MLLEGLRKNTKQSVWLADLWAEIRTQLLLDRKQEWYRFSATFRARLTLRDCRLQWTQRIWLQQLAAEKNLTNYYHLKTLPSSAMTTTSIVAQVLEIEALRTCLSLWYNYIYIYSYIYKIQHYIAIVLWGQNFSWLTVDILLVICVLRSCDKQVGWK
jgi:hypothetical protein